MDEVFDDLERLLVRVQKARQAKEAVSLAYRGNVVEVWEYFYEQGINVDIGSDQTSLHNPWAGGYYPAGLTFKHRPMT
ncbi:MAG: hypothetical protein KatS3mg032_0168 [Cyclobacteriaceae bacterium]|nr:MAG: hypothetical protein KatS3mg032_0168 [Cyclobacteriaceae bacterium]